MRILLYEWHSMGKQDLQEALIRLGHKVDVIPYPLHDFFNDQPFEDRVNELLIQNSYDFFISFNFFPILSKLCNEFHLKYIAWVWDSPLILQFFKSVTLPWNYVFIFDRAIYLELKKLGVNTVYHMPLAVNVQRLDALALQESDFKTYNHDVSFVGNLYEKRNHLDRVPYLPDYLKGYFDAMMKAQMKIHGYNFIEEMLTDDIMSEFSQYATVKDSDDYIGSIKALVADMFFNTKITELERNHLLGLVSENFDFTLYTNSKNVNLPKANVLGYIDYYKVMPKVFRLSKINLNITLRTIKTGIPLRILDVLGAGGFLITNFQSELTEHFEIDRDLVCYESDDDLIQKIEYYLVHEKERKQIAFNGHEKIKNNHTYEMALERIINTVFPFQSEEILGRIQEFDKINFCSQSNNNAEEFNKTDNIQAEIIQSEITQPETIQTGIIQSEIMQPETIQPGAIQSEVIQPETIQTGTIQSEVIQPDIIQPGTIQSEIIQPEAIQPGTIQSEIIQQKDIQQNNIENCSEVIKQIQNLIYLEKIDEAGRQYYEMYRLNNDIQFVKDALFLEDLFDIYTYEKKLGLSHVFNVTNKLDELQVIYKKLLALIIQAEKEIPDSGKLHSSSNINVSLGTKEWKNEEIELIKLVVNKKISYYAVEYIILKYSRKKVELLNLVACLFYENKYNTFVIPFLMKANELDEADNNTLYNISNILVEWNEYDIALEYAEKINEKSARVDILFERLKTNSRV